MVRRKKNQISHFSLGQKGVPVFWSTLTGIVIAGTFAPFLGVVGSSLASGASGASGSGTGGGGEPAIASKLSEDFDGTDPADLALTGAAGGAVTLCTNTLSDLLSFGSEWSSILGLFEGRGAKMLSPTPVIRCCELLCKFCDEVFGDSTRVTPEL